MTTDCSWNYYDVDARISASEKDLPVILHATINTMRHPVDFLQKNTGKI